MHDGITNTQESKQPFLEWRCDKNGLWIDWSGNLATEREASLLDSILLLTDEKKKLIDSLRLMKIDISAIQSRINNSDTGSDNRLQSTDSLRVLHPGLYEDLVRLVKLSDMIGKINDF